MGLLYLSLIFQAHQLISPDLECGGSETSSEVASNLGGAGVDVSESMFQDMVTDSSSEEEDEEDKEKDNENNYGLIPSPIVLKSDCVSDQIVEEEEVEVIKVPITKYDSYISDLNVKYKNMDEYMAQHRKLLETQSIEQFFRENFSYWEHKAQPISDSVNRIINGSFTTFEKSVDFDAALLLGVLNLYDDQGKPIVQTKTANKDFKGCEIDLVKTEEEMMEHCYSLLQTRKRRTEKGVLACKLSQQYFDERFHGVGERLIDVFKRNPCFRRHCKCDYSLSRVNPPMDLKKQVDMKECLFCRMPQNVLTSLDTFESIEKLENFYFLSYPPGRLIQICGPMGRRITLDWEAAARVAHYVSSAAAFMHIVYEIPLSEDGQLSLKIDCILDKFTFVNAKTGVELSVEKYLSVYLDKLVEFCWKFQREVSRLHGYDCAPFLPSLFKAHSKITNMCTLKSQNKKEITVKKFANKKGDRSKNSYLKRKAPSSQQHQQQQQQQQSDLSMSSSSKQAKLDIV